MTSAYNRNYANLNADFNAVGGENKTSLDDHLNAHIDSDMKNQNSRKRNDLSLKVRKHNVKELWFIFDVNRKFIFLFIE